ncbi:MAG: class I SAM-dependent methyltransferase [Gammaproteobacteria bacterium]
MLAHALQVEVVGIDPHGKFDPRATAVVDLRQGYAADLDFDDGAFDLVFSYHVLDHVPEYQKTIAEIHRVLAPGGTACVGTPNRDRLVGYLGSKDAKLHQKFLWNFWDWKARLRGRFRNELGESPEIGVKFRLDGRGGVTGFDTATPYGPVSVSRTR